MNRIASTLAIGVASLFSVAALAAGPSGPKELTSVGVDSTYTVLTSSTPFANPDGCSSSGTAVIKAEGNYKEKTSIALLAFTTAKTVDLWLDGCADSTLGGTVPVVSSITVR